MLFSKTSICFRSIFSFTLCSFAWFFNCLSLHSFALLSAFSASSRSIHTSSSDSSNFVSNSFFFLYQLVVFLTLRFLLVDFYFSARVRFYFIYFFNILIWLY